MSGLRPTEMISSNVQVLLWLKKRKIMCKSIEAKGNIKLEMCNLLGDVREGENSSNCRFLGG